MNKILGHVENFQIGVFFMWSFLRRNKEHLSYFDKISHSVSLSVLVLVIWSKVHVNKSGRFSKNEMLVSH